MDFFIYLFRTQMNRTIPQIIKSAVPIWKKLGTDSCFPIQIREILYGENSSQGIYHLLADSSLYYSKPRF